MQFSHDDDHHLHYAHAVVAKKEVTIKLPVKTQSFGNGSNYHSCLIMVNMDDLKLDELGEASFGIMQLGHLVEVSFGIQ